MGGKASRWRRAAQKLGFPCASFFFSTAETPPNRNSPQSRTISCSAVAVTANTAESKPEEAAPTAVADKSLCAICLEALSCGSGGGDKDIFTAQCAHAFHLACIASNVRHGSITCPICRAHWSHLPRGLTLPSSQQADPILRILDDSIATSRVNRRSSLRAAALYNDDDPIEPAAVATEPEPEPEPGDHRLRFSLVRDLAGPHPPCQYQLTGPSTLTRRPVCLSVKLSHQQATDLVLVASPNGPHLRLLKQSMALVVFSLRAVDRLAIVTYSSAATRAFPLRRMSSHGKRAALHVIDRLFCLGEPDQGEGLRKGVKILEDRAHRNPLSCILHLSDGPTRACAGGDSPQVPVHRFHVGFGFGFGASSGFVMHELEEFLARLLGGVVREAQLRVGEEGELVRLGELRAGQERRIPLALADDREFVHVGYSYIEGGAEEWPRTGEAVLGIEEKGRESCELGGIGGRDLGVGGRRSSCVGRWDHLDPFMARRWAKHLHGCKA